MGLKPENKLDKDRFNRMKQTEKEHGREDQTATGVAAKEVKELREREGRSKHDGDSPR